MEFIEVFYDREKGLTLAEVFYDNERRIITKKISGDMVKLYLGVLANKNIKARRYVENCECIFYDDRCIKIYNYKFIREYGLLTDYLNKVDGQIRVKKAKLSSKVKRRNKYSGKKIIITGLTLLLLLHLTNVALKYKTDEIVVTNSYCYSQTIGTKNGTSGLDDKINTGSGETMLGSVDVSTHIILENADPDKGEEFIYIEYEDRSDCEKASKTKQSYGEMIEKYAEMYGLDSNLVMALATQERGVHSSTMDRGGATGLMQIQNSVWVDNSITAYNFKTGKNETCKITKGSLGDCETNIKLGCMILQDCMKRNNYNILLGLQAYNMGTRGVGRAVLAYAADVGCSKEEIINNPNDCGWLNYREGIAGDPMYVEHVLSYIGDDVSICIYKPDGTPVECFVRNYENAKTR